MEVEMNGFERARSAYENAEPAQDYGICECCDSPVRWEDLRTYIEGQRYCHECVDLKLEERKEKEQCLKIPKQ